MSVTAQFLYDWIVERWSKKATIYSGTVSPIGVVTPAEIFALYVDTQSKIVYSWNGVIWTEGLGGGGLDEAELTILLDDWLTQKTTNDLAEDVAEDKLYFTNAERIKLQGIATGANVNVPTNLSIIRSVSSVFINSDTGTDVTIPSASTSEAGAMSSSDKTKLDALPSSTVLVQTYAPKESPTLTGTPTAPTAIASTNTTQIATTAHVKLALDAGIGSYNETLLSSKFEPIEDDILVLYANKADKTQIGASESGLTKGIASLDTGGKVPLAQLPDFLLGQLIFGGTIDFSILVFSTSINGAAKLRSNTGLNYQPGVGNVDISSNAVGGDVDIAGFEDCQDMYFIVSTVGTYDSGGGVMIPGKVFEGKIYQVGDWLISTGTAWDKVDNTDAVVSVNGKIGAVNIANPDINLTISVPFVEEFPIILSSYKALTIKAIKFKTLAGNCTFYLRRTRSGTHHYTGINVGVLNVGFSPETLNQFYFNASTSLVSVPNGGTDLTLQAGDALSIVIKTVTNSPKMLAITIEVA